MKEVKPADALIVRGRGVLITVKQNAHDFLLHTLRGETVLWAGLPWRVLSVETHCVELDRYDTVGLLVRRFDPSTICDKAEVLGDLARRVLAVKPRLIDGPVTTAERADMVQWHYSREPQDVLELTDEIARLHAMRERILHWIAEQGCLCDEDGADVDLEKHTGACPGVVERLLKLEP